MFAPQDPVPRVLKLQMVESTAEEEADFLLWLRHPNVIGIYEVFTLDVDGARRPIRAIVMDRFLLLTGKQ